MQLAAAMGRLGTESAFEVLARATRLQQEGRRIINLGIGQPDFPTPPHIVEAAVKALRDGHHGYTPANGILPLREAVAADMALRRGFEVHPDRVVIVPGGKVTMFMAIAMFGEPGTEIMYPDPGFPIYRSLIEWTGAKAVPMALHESRGFAFSAEEVLAQITPRTRLMIVNSPANPTGGVVPQVELDRLVAGLARHPQVAVMSDEIYARMRDDGVPHASLHRVSRDRRPADPARRLVQDLRHDRLAAGLGRLAGGSGRACDPAGDQHPFLRQRLGPMGRHRRPDRAAGRGGADGGDLRASGVR